MRQPRAGSPLWKPFALVMRGVAAVYRVSGGRIGGTLRGAPVLLLNHVGRRSGTRRQTPLLYLTDGDRLVLAASKAGSDRHPDWYHNLVAAPETSVLIGRRERAVRARVASAEERAAYWPRLVELYAAFDTYQRRTGGREIPVLILEPR
ncbi:nitroreductase/quinone reductase family protein [Amycolatopsis suaedae]|uniref:Nitroreductase family deazaflavin-dependent oxidoreductase n=1 Tax=Amycolatopsis suaedae TaxID=2510978 RepID=A0A4Q7IXU4_9PSEU|nr:nitroreductase/quinone reductase family protein [Amycolatopsis suaedae]RZQ59249.1 nitroreductase family deazaflavin-dependent oxidoreductase [Amycolatopsis suaedae]